MDINITGDPGTGNTFQEIHIGTVQNYNPNATTVINYNGGEKQKATPTIDKVLQDAGQEQRKAEIMEYVSRLRDNVSKEWKNRYVSTWQKILALPEVEAQVYNPGKQQNTTFNRNLVANIIYIMCKAEVFTTNNAAQLAMVLEGNKEHSVRTQLGRYPTDREIRSAVDALLDK